VKIRWAVKIRLTGWPGARWEEKKYDEDEDEDEDYEED
jgi:hypothetical protein